ncbi:tRNA (guanosine(37)-N1)-methyltransferase TrmD [Patescibacteria group bacterium]|jgi:tRNA (guanine37-N1)-methyltransferase|nr:tRNA (guanosine(37)-N1)-methyltransferase TrmD [Patescibacteria group bacterium]
MHFHIVTLFKEACEAYTNASMLGRAQENKKIDVSYYNPRDFVEGKVHLKVDDSPYGGGPGMVMYAEPILLAVEKALSKNEGKKSEKKDRVKILIMSPRGKTFDQTYAKKLAKSYTDVVLIAGRYEGIDARVKKILKAEEVSTGPYVLTGGELPALTIVDAVSRHIPGVLGKSESIEETRISSGEMYTRPETLVWKGKKYKVPKVLYSGNHKLIDEWRLKKG